MSDDGRSYPDAVRSLTQAARAVAKAERERDEARAERDRAVDQANNIAAEWIVTERERDELRATLERLPDLLREESPEGAALREQLGLRWWAQNKVTITPQNGERHKVISGRMLCGRWEELP